MSLVRSIVLVDGENLTLRFQAMVGSGAKPRPNVAHKQDVFVWTSELGGRAVIDTDVLRINYYTSMVGDEDLVASIKEEIAALRFYGVGDLYGACQVLPRVYKKAKKSTKSRLVDINIAIDAMRHVYSDAVEVVYLFSGDGDFLNLVEELARSGKKVCLAAFSSGLEPKLKSAVDRFVLLDRFYFEEADA